MSAIPVRFATALYALRERAGLKRGEVSEYMTLFDRMELTI